ncbi:gag-protease polyprotein [Trifolium medium]|uniref:Gag-protease polyprotein n=1 Tax=Trifolium medium TaxID=97028 RepID=A0A392MHK4_9FABA|nr:gag-protease polyprotein [Trifolium medium]
MSDEKLVSKMLRSLPKRFDMKVTAIEEAQNLSTMQLEELVGSLQTYELGKNQRNEKKNKSIAFVSNAGDEEPLGDLDSDESLSEAIVLLGRQFNKVLRRMDKRPKSNVPSIKFDISKQANSQRKNRGDEKTSQSKGVQCHECEGYGHIRTECATFLKRQKKSLAVTWSDEDDSEEEIENESAKHVHALTGICASDTKSCDDELSYEELATTYKYFFNRSTDLCKALEKQKKINGELQAERQDHLAKIVELNTEVIKLNTDLGLVKKHARMMIGKGTEEFEEMLKKQVLGKSKPIGFDYERVNQRMNYNQDTKYTHIRKTFPISSGFMTHHLPTHQDTETRKKPKTRSRPWICHYYGRKGHIRPFCFKLYGYPKRAPQSIHKPEVINTQKEWRKKKKRLA